MNKDFTFIAAILDRSGSMARVADETISGFNSFVNDQKAAPGKALLTLVIFDDVYEPVWEARPLQEVPKLTSEIYYTRGYTALNDAVMRTIDSVGEKLKAMPEEERPDKVVFFVMTDGQENASKEYPKDAGGSLKVAEKIKHQREKYSWEFVFVGANIDAVQTAQNYGISANTALQYDANPIGAANALRAASASIRGFRGGQSLDKAVFAASQGLEGVGVNATTGPAKP